MNENCKMNEECKNCNNQQACVPFFMVENSLMHKDADNERLAKVADGQRKINVIQSIILLAVVFIMVVFYTARTQMWNNTIAKQNETIIKLLNERSPGTEVDNAKQTTPP
jgi:hypothetical protein